MKCTIVNKFFSTMEAISEMNVSELSSLGTGNLTGSEIKFLASVKDSPDANSIELAKKLNITKGSVSQTGKSLIEKGFLESYNKPNNKKEKFYRFTEEGNNFYEKTLEFHKDGNQSICEYLQNLDFNERQAILGFLEAVGNKPISDFDCRGYCKNES